MTDLETAVGELQAVPLEDFVAERKRLAKDLRDAGERAAAAELAKLPKPSAPAWALNHVAREREELVGEWLAAVDALRDASTHADRASGDALRAAMAGHREATRRLLAAVREDARPNGRSLTEPMLDRVRELLQAATAEPERAEQLRAARVVEGDDEAPAGGSERGSTEDTATKEASKSAAKTGATDGAGNKSASKQGATKAAAEKRAAAEERAATRRAQREAEERAQLERLVGEAEARVNALREAADETEGAALRAEERLEEATRTLHRSEFEADAARQAAGDAAQAVKQAERELEKLAGKLAS